MQVFIKKDEQKLINFCWKVKNIKKAQAIAHDKKVTDFLNKIDFENIDKAIALLEERKNHPKEIIEDIKGE